MVNRIVPFLTLLLCFTNEPLVLAQDVASTSAAALTVSTINPDLQDWDETVTASGWLAPWHEAVVASETGGLQVSDILVDVGSVVRKGDVLALLSSESVLADIAKQEAALETARANLAEANANAERGRKLDGTGALSAQTMTQYVIAQRTGEASVASEQAALDSEKIKLKQTRILAIDDGVISSRSATLGSVVSSGTEMFRLIRQNRVEWQAEVSAQDLSAIREGQSAHLKLSDGSFVEGLVRLVAPTIDKETGRSLVYVSLPAGAARTGQYVTGELKISRSPARVVPQSAVVQRDGMSYVFVLTGADRVARKKVDTGRRQDGLVEITSAIDQYAKVVASGGAFLADGALVKVVQKAEAGE